MKSKRWIILVAVIGLIALTAPALILANFSSMTSQMEHNSSLATSTGSIDPAQPIYPQMTGLVVTGDERLAAALRDQIVRQLQGSPAFGQIQVLSGIVERVDFPILLIEITQKEILWTPIYARANLQINLAYASNGDISFRLTRPTEFKQTGSETSIQRSGQYTFSDVSWGIISSPGYIDYLAREIVRPISNDLRGKINN
jgi:hypothetical protein